MDEIRKDGYLAGIGSFIIAMLFLLISANSGFIKDLASQFCLIMGALFGSLSIGSFIKPDTIGQITVELLKNMQKNVEKSNESNKKQNIQIVQNIGKVEGDVNTIAGSKNSTIKKKVKNQDRRN